MKLNISDKEIIIDDEDYDRIKMYTWYYLYTRGKEYAITYVSGRSIYLHRIIMNAEPTQEIDHKDGNGLNNKKSNLRIVTHQQNLANQKLSRANNLGFKGIKRSRSCKTKERWQAQGKFNQQMFHLGTYDTKEDAAKAYDRFMIEKFGEFAMTNERLGLLNG